MKKKAAAFLVAAVFLAFWPAGIVRGGVLSTKEGPGQGPKRIDLRGEAYFHMMKALFVARQGHAGQAIRDINEAVKLDPDSADLKAEAASLLQQMGQEQQAERLVRQALQAEPNHRRALSILADILTKKVLAARGTGEGTAEAISVYERLLKLPDPEPDYFRLLTTFYIRADNIPGAIRTARAYVRTHQGDAQAIRMLANVLLHADRDAEAIDAVVHFLAETEGIDGDGDGFQDAVALLVNLVRGQDAWEKMVEVGPELVEVRPENGDLRAIYGEALLRLRRPEEAGVQMEKALELADGDPMLRYQLATVYSTQGRIAEAVELARGLAAEYPDHAQVRSLLAEMLTEQGKLEEALGEYRQGLRLISEEPAEAVRRDEMRLRIVALQLELKKPDEAQATLATLEDVSSVDALELAAETAIARQDWEDAIRYAGKMRSRGEEARGDLLECRIFALSGETGKARKRFAKIESRLGSRGRLVASNAFFEGREPGTGLSILERWREEEPASSAVRYYLGQYLDRMGRSRQSERELREAIRLDPENADALNHLGYSLLERNEKLQEALDLIRQAVKIHPWRGAYLDSLGWAYFKLGRYESALEPLEQAARELPTDPTILDHLGDLYLKLGRNESALKSWRSALEAGPGEGSEVIQAKIASLLGQGAEDR